MIKNVKKEVILLIWMMIISLIVCGAVTAHPGHGTPIEEPSDPGTGDGTSTGTIDTGSTSTATSSGTSSSTASTSSRSTSSSATKSSSTSGGTDQTAADTQTATDAKASSSVPEEVIENTESSMDLVGGPIAMIGLMVVVGLIAMSFPYQEGGNLSKLQMRLFGR